MKSWISKVFSGDDDYLERYLGKISSFERDTKFLFNNFDGMIDCVDYQKCLINMSTRICYCLKGKQIGKISQNDPLYPSISSLLSPLIRSVIYIQHLSDFNIIIECLELLLQITTEPFYDTNVHLLILTYLDLFFSKNANQSAIGKILEYFSNNEVFMKDVITFYFYKCIMNQFCSRQYLSNHLEWTAINLFPKFSTIKLPSDETSKVINLLFRYIKEDLIHESNYYNCMNAFLTLILFHTENISNAVMYMSSKNYIESAFLFIENKCNNHPLDLFYQLCTLSSNGLNSIIAERLCERVMESDIEIDMFHRYINVLNKIVLNAQIEFSLIDESIQFQDILIHYLNKYSAVSIEIAHLFSSLSIRRYRLLFDLINLLLSPIYSASLETYDVFFKSLLELFEEQIYSYDDFSLTIFTFITKHRNCSNMIKLLHFSPAFLSIINQFYCQHFTQQKQWEIVYFLLMNEGMFINSAKFVQIVSGFVSGYTSRFVIKRLMTFVSNNPKESLLSIFISLFSEQESAVFIFMNNNGLNWLNYIILSKRIPDYVISLLISSILDYQSANSVSSWISSLSTDHPLFGYASDLLWHIVFGSTSRLFEVRVFSLLPHINIPSLKLSPYNAYIASKLSVKDFFRHKISIDDNTTFSQIANRYVSPELFGIILESSNNPLAYADHRYDHFALFEFKDVRGSYLNIKASKSKAVSFWFKSENSLPDNLEILSCSLVIIRIRNKELCFRNRERSITTQITPNTWYLVIISHNSNKGRVEVFINNESFCLQLCDSPPGFDECIFGKGNNQNLNRWYIGTAIRFFSSPVSESKTIFDKGPGFLKSIQLFEENQIITPYSSIKIMGNELKLVPYLGFPSYLLRQSHFFRVIRILMNSTCSKRISDLIKMLISASSIFNVFIPGFWSYIKICIRDRLDYIDNGIFEFVMNSYLSKIDVISSNNRLVFFGDILLWKRFPSIIADSLLKASLTNPTFMPVSIVSSIYSHQYINGGDNIVKEIVTKRMVQAGLFEQLMHLLIISEPSHQILLLSAITSIIENCSIKAISDTFSLSKCIEFMLVVPTDSAIRITNLVCFISSRDPDYIDSSFSLTFALLRQITNIEIWNIMFSILTGQHIKNQETDSTFDVFEKSSIKRPRFLPCLISFLICSLVTCINVRSSSNDFSAPYLIFEKRTIKSLDIINAYISKNRKMMVESEMSEYICLFAPLLSGLSIIDHFPISIPNLDEDAPDVTESNSYLFELWGVSFDAYKWFLTNQASPMFLTSLSPLFSLLIPTIQKFSSSYTTGIHVDESLGIFFLKPSVQEFFCNLLLSHVSKSKCFDRVSRAILFQYPFNQHKILNGFATNLLIRFLTYPQLHKFSPESLENLLFFISVSVFQGFFNNNIFIVFSYVYPFASALQFLQNSEALRKTKIFYMSIRFIVLSSLSESKLPDSVYTVLYSNPELFCDFDGDFFDDDYCYSLLFLLLKQLEDLNTIYMSNLLFFIKCLKDHERCLSLQCKAFLDFINQRFDSENNIGGLYNWISLNPIDYKQVTEELELRYNVYISKYDSFFQDYISPSQDIEENQLLIQKFSNEIKDNQQRLQRLIFYLPSTLKLLSNIVQNHFFRYLESEYISFLYQISISKFQEYDCFCGKSYFSSLCNLPFMPQRVLSPSFISLPKIEEGSKLLSINDYCDAILSDLPLKTSQSPTIFSKSFIEPNSYVYYALFSKTFFSRFGEIKESYSIGFLKYINPISSSLFTFDDYLVLLLNSKVLDGQLFLFDEIPNNMSYLIVFYMLFNGFYGEFSMFCGHPILICPISDIYNVQDHSWNRQSNSIEIFSSKSASYIIIFNEIQSFNSLKNIFSGRVFEIENENNIHTLSVNQLKSLWMTRKISSYHYLLGLNGLAGRSFSDITQYPVFPWIINDYCSEILPLECFRDLEKPIGQQSVFKSNYYSSVFKDTNGGHFYGSHYSMPASIHYFLIRVPPFTFLDWDMHNGWDNNLRMFKSLELSCDSSFNSNINDVKEIIPEMFCFPEALIDSNQLCMMNNGITDVNNAKWAKSYFHFCYYNRYCLETSNSLSLWIDLVFGYKQSGDISIESKNLFLPSTYSSYNGEGIDDVSLGVLLENWGQCPIQLFFKKHESQNETNYKNPQFDFNIKSSKIIPDESSLVLKNQCYYFTLRSMLFYNIDNKQLHFSYDSKRNDLLDLLEFCDVKSISVSKNNRFMVLNTEDIIIVYELKWSKDVISNLVLFCEMFIDGSSSTKINGYDMICVSIHYNTLILWDFIRPAIHRVLNHKQQIIDTCFDEYIGIVWVLFEHEVYIYTINGTLVSHIEIVPSCTSICIPNYSDTTLVRPVVVGMTSGEIYFVEFDVINGSIRTDQILSTKASYIKKVFFTHNDIEFVYVDANDKAYHIITSSK